MLCRGNSQDGKTKGIKDKSQVNLNVKSIMNDFDYIFHAFRYKFPFLPCLLSPDVLCQRRHIRWCHIHPMRRRKVRYGAFANQLYYKWYPFVVYKRKKKEINFTSILMSKGNGDFNIHLNNDDCDLPWYVYQASYQHLYTFRYFCI